MEDEYKNIHSGEKVKILSDFGNSYLLDNNKTITKQVFSTNYAFSTNIIKNNNETKMNDQVIDPLAFFKKPVSNIDFSNLSAPVAIGSGGVVDNAPVQQNNQQQYNNANQSNNFGVDIEAQHKRMMETYNNSRGNQQFNNNIPPINNNDPFSDVRFEQPVKQQDPVINLLSSAKRSHKMEINITMDYNIPNPDFIKMMADNLEGDFIKTYADEFISNLLSDRASLYEKVYEKIKNEIYGEKTQVKKRTIKK